MKTISLLSVWVVMMFAGAIAANAAQAATPYDGDWTVTITSPSGDCGSGSSFGLEVRDGVVRGHGGFDVSGSVAHNGTVRVQISSGDRSASGSGRLSARSGGGTWSGSGPRGACRGRWSASRG
jgi:hypothetical protein